MRPTPHPDWVAEDDLATELNVPRSVLVLGRRELLATAEVDSDGPWVVWRKTAATRFAASLGLVWPAVATTEPAKKTAPAPEELTVVSAPRGDGWHFPNHHIIRAQRANGEQVDVQVWDSSKYTTHLRTGEPMKFKALPSPAGLHWVLVGREPRFKGGW